MSEAEERSGAVRSHVVERQCEAVRENGERCRMIPALGERLCHVHERFRETARSMVMTVPVMDDEASITFVRSQAARALAHGSIPPANGRAILEACRDAERRLDRRLAVQKAAMRYAALAEKMGAEKLQALMAEFVERQETGGRSQETGVRRQETAASDQRSAIGDQGPESVEGEAAVQHVPEGAGAAGGVEPEPVLHLSVFPGVKKQWEGSLMRTEDKIMEMCAPAEGQSWYEFLAQKKEREAAIAAAV